MSHIFQARYVSQLPPLAIGALSRSLQRAGITGDALSIALDGRLSDLGDVLSAETLNAIASITDDHESVHGDPVWSSAETDRIAGKEWYRADSPVFTNGYDGNPGTYYLTASL